MFHEKNIEKNAFEEIEGVNAVFFGKKTSKVFADSKIVVPLQP